MNNSLYHIQLYSWILLISGVIALIIANILFKKYTITRARILAWLEIAVAIWCFGMTLESAATTVSLKTFWSQVAYPGSTSAPVLFLLFAMAYSQFEKNLTRKNVIILFILPVLTTLMAFTNNYHHWIWTEINIDAHTNIALYGHGPWFWMFIVFAYSSLLTGIIIFLISFRRFPGFYKEHTFAIVLASIIPITGNIIYVFNINPVPGLEWTPIAFMFSGAILAFSIFKFHIFDLVPIARNNIVEAINDNIIVFDNKDRIVDINPVMRRVLEKYSNELIGRLYMELPAPWKNMIISLYGKPDEHYDTIIEVDGKKTYYDAQLVTLRDKKQKIIGRLYIFHDISKRKLLELEREDLIEELQGALAEVKTLSGLLPICASCKKIRDDNGEWHQVETYVTKHSEAKFSHGICPECRAKLYPGYTEKK